MPSGQEKPFFSTIRTKKEERPDTPIRGHLHDIIFEADTPAGKAFDVLLLVLIALSILAVTLESVIEIQLEYGRWLYIVEWVFTILFSIEYGFRLASVRHPYRYALSFFGIIDLLAVIPTYLSLFIAGAQTLLVIRVIRLLRIFRIFKLTRYMGEARILTQALKASRHKIVVFLGGVLSILVIMGTLMYLIEGPEHGFTSIPRAMYWAVVTMTTVGYGDIAPQTILGQALSALIMILGYSIIVVPTGIFSVEIAQAARSHWNPSSVSCPSCNWSEHDTDSKFCKKCGASLAQGPKESSNHKGQP